MVLGWTANLKLPTAVGIHPAFRRRRMSTARAVQRVNNDRSRPERSPSGSPAEAESGRPVDHGLTAKDKTSREALDTLEDTVAAVYGDGGHTPTDSMTRMGFEQQE